MNASVNTGSKRWAVIVLAVLLLLLGIQALFHIQVDQAPFVIGVIEIGDALLWLFER